jgi:hypothetical protein
MNIFQIIKKLIAPMPTRKIRHGLNASDLQEIKRKWNEIEELIRLGKPSNFKVAILEADKLLDHVLGLYGYYGSLADKMKALPRNRYDKSFFDDMWSAHLLRNRMVHNMDYEVQNYEAKEAIGKFGKTLRELGAL